MTTYKNTWRHNPEDGNSNFHPYENIVPQTRYLDGQFFFPENTTFYTAG
jgi:hypothetical protein